MLIGVDGGVSLSNAGRIAGWGIDVIVSGSAIFDRRSPARNLELMIEALQHPVPEGLIQEEVHGRQ